jgi:tRNA(Ile)-lysidine synthetase-like protein
MELLLAKGIYIVAVSGGVDSMVLLDLAIKLTHQNEDFKIVVAHVNHGIRPDSGEDEKLVRSIAVKNDLPYETTELSLGENASELEARTKRYDFLKEVAQKYSAGTIITAHHQDDIIETAVINVLRGTGRRGLTSLSSRSDLMRPLLQYTKQELVDYARTKGIIWREDSTNTDSKYLRNHIRHNVIAQAREGWKESFMKHISDCRSINLQLDSELSKVLGYKIRGGKAVMARSWFTKLDHTVASEIMYAFLTRVQINDIDKHMIEMLTIATKVGKVGARFDLDALSYALLTKRSLRVMNRKTNKTKHL